MGERPQSGVVRVEGPEKGASESVMFVGRRAYYLDTLEEVIELAKKKVKTRSNTNKVKAAWARIIVHSCSTAGGIFRDIHLEELEKRIKAIEEAL